MIANGPFIATGGRIETSIQTVDDIIADGADFLSTSTLTFQGTNQELVLGGDDTMVH